MTYHVVDDYRHSSGQAQAEQVDHQQTDEQESALGARRHGVVPKESRHKQEKDDSGELAAEAREVADHEVETVLRRMTVVSRVET